MTELTDQLEKLIQQAALDGALTEDAVAQFHTLVMERNSLKEANEEWEVTHANVVKNRDALKEKLRVHEEAANELSVRAAAVEEAEDEHRDRKVRLECAELRVQDHVNMFQTVFRNSVLRREVMTPVTPGPIDQYGNKQSDVYPARDTVEEEET